MNYDEIRKRAATESTVSVPATWAQGRTVFGGLSAALLADTLSRQNEDDRRLRYLEIGFVRPLMTEHPFELSSEPISSGRTVAVQSGQIVQDGAVRVTAQANFVRALASETPVEIDNFKAPELIPPDHEHCHRVEGAVAPVFTQHIDFRFAGGGAPFSGRGSDELCGWMRFDEPPAQLDTTHLVTLIDAWPPLVSSYYKRPVSMSSVNWQLHFAEPVDGISGSEFLGYRAHANFFRDGYGSSSAEIWAPDGRLLAKSFQTFLVFS
ncbi:MAG: thioesterase family protein [Pseudomonadota bacterium]